MERHNTTILLIGNFEIGSSLENSPSVISPATPADYRLPRILLNAAPLGRIITGVGRYTRALYQALHDLKLAEISYYCGGRIVNTMPRQGSKAVSRFVPARARNIARRLRLSAEERYLERYLSRHEHSVYHETGLFPQLRNSSTPVVMTIYDLSLITHKDTHPADRVEHFERYFYERLDSVSHIITISDFVKQEIINMLGVPRNKVSAIPLAAAGHFARRPERVVGHYLERNNIPSQYVLTVATQEPRKNLIGLVEALAMLPPDITLVCAGWSGWLNDAFVDSIRKLRVSQRTIRLGHVTDEELCCLYSGARLMVYPSLYEGFGLPILEAMACGCPVICSDRSSMPEVAGQAAVLVDPANYSRMAEQVKRIWYDDTVRQRLIQLGYARAKEFNWSITARETVEVMNRVARRGAE